MSIDWDKRQGTLGKHRHLAEDILSQDTGEPSSVQTVTLFGPYRVSYDDVSTTDPPNTLGEGYTVYVADLPNGCTIIKTWAETVAEFTGFVAGGLAIKVGPADEPGKTVSIWKGTFSGSSSDTINVSEPTADALDMNIRGYRITEDGARLGAAWVEDDGLPDTGSADIYALIAESS